MPKIKTFEGLRGYAIIMIFISHCNYILNDHGFNIFGYLGAFGVSVFIMLSGFLANYSNHYDNSIVPISLLRKKMKRFYPLHIVTLLIAVPFCLSGNLFKRIVVFGINAVLLQAWFPRESIYFSYNAVSWYLSVTVFFIMMRTVTVRVLNKINKKQVAFSIVIAIGIEFFWSLFFMEKTYAHWIIYICPLIRYVDYFIGGGYTNFFAIRIIKWSQI